MTAVMSERDVVFTPFMLRVRAALAGELPEPAKPRLEPSVTRRIAVAVDEWFSLRARAEQLVAEANAMLGAGQERIELRDEYGTEVLAFVIARRGGWLRLLVHRDEQTRGGRVEIDRPGGASPMHPVDLGFLEDLLVSMLEKNENQEA
jgi:hypothetical protein